MMQETVGRLLAAGNVAEVFEWGSRVLKLYRSASAKPVVFREAAIHAVVETMGLLVPAVWVVRQIGERWGIMLDRVGGVSFATRMRDNPGAIPQYLEILARLHAQIHSHPADQFASLKARLATNIARGKLLDEPPEGDRLCHGDFHPWNVLGEASQPIVIDWPDACRGNPAADACRSYLLLKLNAEEIAEPYLDAWCPVTDVVRGKVTDWLPHIAAARLAENVPGEFDRLLETAQS